MNTFLIILAILAVLFGAFLMMRVRVRLELVGEERRLFFGLGRSGPEFDFRAGRGRVKLFGLSVRSFPLRRGSAPKRPDTPKSDTTVRKPARRRRRPSWSELLTLLPRLGRATWDFLPGLLADLLIAVALPVYRLIYRTGIWMIKINVLKLVRMTIGTKEGGRDVQ